MGAADAGSAPMPISARPILQPADIVCTGTGADSNANGYQTHRRSNRAVWNNTAPLCLVKNQSVVGQVT